MYPIKYRLFRELVEENTELLKNALRKDIPLTDILSKIKTLDWVETGRRLHSNVIMRKSFDILPSSYMGLLSYTASNGTDAIKVNPDGSITEYELKTAEVNSSRLWQSIKGTVYVGKANNKDYRASVKAQFDAKYHLYSKEQLLAKNMKTVLFCADPTGKDGYFDAWELQGDAVIERLTTDQQGRKLRGDISKRTLMLNTFMNQGSQAKTVVPLLGYDNWIANVRKKAPVLKANEIFQG